ncbi:MAG TPA: UDP-N-acetylmuramoyl-L-alanyl-D-glutamate--2,6-diaminopimelate ligase [Dehalococcoidia bacterium]|nr:UDP-N-acetylmuramoyl-L-alanyl-D-glutamate--2,6-diaminopimelate ligase [Dehalococcoidia bacterium]
MTARGDWREGLPPDVRPNVLSDLPSDVAAIRHDSRDVDPGDLFVCVVGAQADGHDFAAAAVEGGAVAIVAQAGRGEALMPLGVPVVEVPDSRRALSSIAAAHEGYPARQLTVVGITGTNGKSTTAYFAGAALEGAGVKTGVLTTIGSRIDGVDAPHPTRLTTQEAPVIQRQLAEMVEAGCTHAVVEATSHGLDLLRLVDCEFDIAVFTNLTPDHLDHHGTLDAYRDAKLRLFTMLDEPTTKDVSRVAIVNLDSDEWEPFAAASSVPVMSYSIDDRSANLSARDIIAWPDGSTFAVAATGASVEASVRLPGAFNISNATAALAVAWALDLDVGGAAMGVATCEGVPGRMERIGGAPFDVIVDYAHTADAMQRVLETLAEVVDGRLIVVFGCAGERSSERRSGLGAVAGELAGYAVLTEEDPRSEDGDAIIDDIARAMTAAGATEGERFERVPDRREAIDRAFAIAEQGDLVLLAGKGHESSIERAGGPVAWSESGMARELIAARFG